MNIIGDGGYITKESYNIFDRKIHIIAPVRKNMKRHGEDDNIKYNK